MKGIKILLALIMCALALPTAAQYSQLEAKSEFMLKVEAGYLPFMGNTGTADVSGYYVDRFHNAANLNVMAGVNISQDWFVGGGAGFLYLHNMQQRDVQSMMCANVFVDVDFRPIWQGLMGVDYQPSTIKWAPEIGGRLGGSVLLDQPYYGTTITPMGEFYGGINYYYRHGLRNMGHNWHSFYLTIGVAFFQQAVFLPVRVGWRW